MTVDMVSFMLAHVVDHEKRPFVRHNVSVDMSTKYSWTRVFAIIPDLEPDTEYHFMASAHARNQTNSDIYWSDVVHYVPGPYQTCKSMWSGLPPWVTTATPQAAPPAPSNMTCVD